MNNGIVKIIIAVVLGFIVLRSCNSCSNRNSNTWEKSPVDELITQLNEEQNYAIILLDMDYRDDKYYHKYNVIVERPDTVLSTNTSWRETSATFFNANVENMGMEIATKKDGKLSKQASPAGYNHYVGNSKYGEWQQRNGSSFWHFYGQYAFMSSMFNLASYPARRSYWDGYSNGGYYGSRSYYGPSGRSVYGTKTYTSSNVGKSSTWGNRPSSFKQNVRNQVKRSASASNRSRTSRSSSRYSNSSSRSRSRSFGK